MSVCGGRERLGDRHKMCALEHIQGGSWDSQYQLDGGVYGSCAVVNVRHK